MNILRLALSLLVLAGVAAAADIEPRTYRIGMCPWIAWSPMHVAEAKGLWKKQGIDVQVINQLGEEEHTAAIENKRVDLGMDMIGNFIGMQQKGSDITILGELDWSHGGDKVIVKDAKTGTRKGDTIGIYHNDPAVLMLLDRYLAERKLRLADVTIAEYDPEQLTGHFITGRFSTIISYDPHAMQVERDGGVTLASTARYPGCMPEGLGGRRDVIATIPREDMAKILSGWMEGVKWMNEPANRSEYLQILNQKTFGGPAAYSDEEVRKMLANVRIHDAAALRERNLSPTALPAFVTDVRRMLEDNGMLKRDFSASILVDTRILVEVLEHETKGKSAN
jgi:NitT/TauT family transport system substrate-binding protein